MRNNKLYMKKIIILLVYVIIPLLCFAQGTVSRPTQPVNPHKKHNPVKPRRDYNQTSASSATLYIKGASFGNTKKDGTVIGSYGSTLNASDIRFLCSRLKYNGPSTSQSKTVYVKIFKPNGELLSSSSSPSGYTYSWEAVFEPGKDNSVNLGGWGNDESSSYGPGIYNFEYYFDGMKQYSSFVNLQKKAGEAEYLRVDNTTSVTASFGASTSSKIFYVSTDADSWTTWGVPSWCGITDKSSTSFKLTCYANTSTTSRSDYMKVKAGDKEVRIDIRQEAGTSARAYTGGSYNSYSNSGKEGKNWKRGFNPFEIDYRKREYGIAVSFIQKWYKITYEGNSINSDYWLDEHKMSGLRMGIPIQPVFGYGIGINTGLYCDMVFSFNDEQEGMAGEEIMLTDVSLYMPVHLLYRLPLSENFSVFLNGGIGLDLGLVQTLSANGYEDLNLEYGEDGMQNRFNVAGEFGGGIQFKAFQLSAGYSIGLTNNKNFMGVDGCKTTINHWDCTLSILF